MKIRNKAIGFSGVALLALTAAVSLGASPVNALPTEVPSEPAAVGDIVCNAWTSGIYNVRATKTAARTFTVQITDTNTLAAESAKQGADHFIRLPESPVDLRKSTNTVSLNPALQVGNINISQSVTPGMPLSNSNEWDIDEYLESATAPWESFVKTDESIVWVQDIDARSDENGVQVVPSDFEFFPFALTYESAGVLQFTVTVPNRLSGEVALLNGMSTSFTSGLYGSDETWHPGAVITATTPGCTISIEAVEETKPEVKPEVPGVATPPARIDTAA